MREWILSKRLDPLLQEPLGHHLLLLQPPLGTHLLLLTAIVELFQVPLLLVIPGIPEQPGIGIPGTHRLLATVELQRTDLVTPGPHLLLSTIVELFQVPLHLVIPGIPDEPGIGIPGTHRLLATVELQRTDLVIPGQHLLLLIIIVELVIPGPPQLLEIVELLRTDLVIPGPHLLLLIIVERHRQHPGILMLDLDPFFRIFLQILNLS